jgi:hypothetical protein
MEIFRSGKEKIQTRDKHPGSATLISSQPFSVKKRRATSATEGTVTGPAPVPVSITYGTYGIRLDMVYP